MGVHLRKLRGCDICNRPAVHQLYNAVNAPGLMYCDRHAAKALREFIKKHGEN